MRDEDGVYVIEITPFIRVLLLVLAVMVVVFTVWKCSRPSEATLRASSPSVYTFPKEFPRAESPEELMPVEVALGVKNNSPFNIERLSRADRAELEKIFEDIQSEGTPDPMGEESSIFESIMQRSAEIAPVRSFQFFDLVENPNRRAFALKHLFRNWFRIDEKAAMEHVQHLAEPERYYLTIDEALRFVDTDPNLAVRLVEQGEAAQFFWEARPKIMRPVFKKWGNVDPGPAVAAIKTLVRADHQRQAGQGLALNRLEKNSWEEVFSWAESLPTPAAVESAKRTALEFGAFTDPDAAQPRVNAMDLSPFKDHLNRQLQASREIKKAPSGEQGARAYRLAHSLDPREAHDRACLINTLTNPKVRENEAYFLLTRFPSLASTAYVENGHLFIDQPNFPINQGAFQDLTTQAAIAVENGNLSEARRLLLKSLYNYPKNEETHRVFIDLAKKEGSWLGEKATILDQVIVEPATYEITRIEPLLDAVAKQIKTQKGVTFHYYFFEGITGKSTESYATAGGYGKVTAREAIEAITTNLIVSLDTTEFGLLGSYFRDEDIDINLETPLSEWTQ